jgi:hypothetical protein
MYKLEARLSGKCFAGLSWRNKRYVMKACIHTERHTHVSLHLTTIELLYEISIVPKHTSHVLQMQSTRNPLKHRNGLSSAG